MATELSELPDAAGHFDRFSAESSFRRRCTRPWCSWSTSSAPRWPTRRSARDWPRLLADYTGRPARSPRPAGSQNMPSRRPARGARRLIVLKREDLNHTGSHKINNVLGQALLARADGQDPGDRRDRRRAARGGHGHRGGAVRHGLHGLHGQGRHRAAGAQRGPDAAARRRGDRGRVRHPDAQGRDERRDARLGRHRRLHPLPDRVGRRPAPVPDDGPGVPAGDRHRGPGAGAGSLRPAARRGGRLRRRRLQRAWHLRRLHRPTPMSALYGFEAGGEGVETGRHAATISAGESACCTACGPTCCRTRTARPRSPTRSRRASTIPASAPSTPGWPRPAGRTTSRSPTPRPWRRSGCCRGPKASCRLSSRPTRWPAHSSSLPRLPARADGQPPLILVNLSGRGDKDVDTAIKWFDLDTRGHGSESGRPTGDTSPDGGGLAMGGPSSGAGEQV